MPDPLPEITHWEKCVEPPKGLNNDCILTAPRTLISLDNSELGDKFLACEYTPTYSLESQDITIYFGDPVFIMSPRIKLYRPDQIFRFKGHLQAFVPTGMSEEDEPQLEVTIALTTKPKMG